MELIRIFTSILLALCFITCTNFEKINKYVKDSTINEYSKNSVYGLVLHDFKGKVRVGKVLEYSPAQIAGIEQGDKILEVEGEKIKDVKNFLEYIENFQAKDTVKLTIYRVDSCSKFPVEINKNCKNRQSKI